MAYADATHTQRNVSTVALVAVLEAALAIGVVAGLSHQYRSRPDTVLTTTDITPPAPEIDKPIDPPKPKRETTKLIDTPIPQRDSEFDLGPVTPPITGEDTGSGGGIEIVAFPTPTPSPVPSFTALKARPRGNPANWVTENDYPTSEIRAEHQGRTAFRVSVDAAGKVTDCAITSSSGWPVLDATTCEKLARRARFEAAVDSTGAKTAGSYNGTVNWRLPEE